MPPRDTQVHMKHDDHASNRFLSSLPADFGMFPHDNRSPEWKQEWAQTLRSNSPRGVAILFTDQYKRNFTPALKFEADVITSTPGLDIHVFDANMKQVSLQDWLDYLANPTYKTDVQYYCFRAYGNNYFYLIPTTEAEWEDNRLAYPACFKGSPHSRDGGFYELAAQNGARAGKFISDSQLGRRWGNPEMTYCADTYWYMYFWVKARKFNGSFPDYGTILDFQASAHEMP